jgi:hypothetical protein
VNHRADGPASGRSRLAHLVLHSFGGAEAPRRRRPMRMDRTRTATAADAFLESRHTTHPPTSPGPVATRQDTDTCKSTRSFPRHRSFCCVHRRSLQRECRSFGTIEKIRMVGCALPAANFTRANLRRPSATHLSEFFKSAQPSRKFLAPEIACVKHNRHTPGTTIQV